MIVVTVELHSARTGQVKLLGKAIIANDGTGTDARGNYDVTVGYANESGLKKILDRPLRRGRVVNYPRHRKHFWQLIERAFASVYGPLCKGGK